MKKSLLFSLAAVAAMSMSAQNYTAVSTPVEDEEYADGYDGGVTIGDKTVTIESYDDYVILRGWLGDTGYDLKVAFDEEENVTSLTPISLGVEGDTFTKGYAAFYTKNSAYYYVQLYLAAGYNYAYSDEEGGYVFLSGYFYESSSSYTWMYYYISWEYVEGEVLYHVEVVPSTYEDWESMSAFLPGKKVGVDVYADQIALNGWSGVEYYDLVIAFNEEGVTSVKASTPEENGTPVTSGVCTTPTGNSEYPTAKFDIGAETSFAYANASEGYVLLSGTFEKANGDATPMYYYVAWDENTVGITDVTVTEGPAEFYTIGGVRVGQPTAAGIYIVRCGSKVNKVVIR